MRGRIWVVASALGLAIAGYGASAAAQVQQVHMQKALADLQDAKKELELAERDKGGHRKIAEQMVDEAISQVHEGMDVRARQTAPPRRR